MTKLADEQSGSLNSVMVCSIGSVNAEWLVNLHAGVRSHVFYCLPLTSPMQYGLGCCDHANFRIMKLAEEHNGSLNSAAV